MTRTNCLKTLHQLLIVLLILPSCTFLSNRDYVRGHPEYQGTRHIVIFIKRWPFYLQRPEQLNLGADFIKTKTLFYAPFEPAAHINPRAIDIQDIDDHLIGEVLVKVLEKKGYQTFIADIQPMASGAETVAEIMARYQVIDRQVNAFLFCFYSPIVFLSHAQLTPKERGTRAYGLEEVVQILQPGSRRVIWAGPRAAMAPPNSINHAFIYLSLSLFKALNWQTLWEVADSQVGGKVRPRLVQCPPPPTDLNYWADAGIIQRLMVQNLECRLRHIIPDSF
jgi:hypothetical protein